jgi:hypothetical protein
MYNPREFRIFWAVEASEAGKSKGKNIKLEISKYK